MVLFHGSDTAYDFPVLSYCGAMYNVAVKAALGYYVTPIKTLAASCGKYLYQVEMKPDAVVEDMALSVQIEHYNSVNFMDRAIGEAYFRSLRDQFVKDGCDILMIREGDGMCGESVILNLDAIASFTLVGVDGKPVANPSKKRR